MTNTSKKKSDAGKVETEQDRIARKKKEFLEYFKETPIQKFGAAYIGVHKNTIGEWKKNDRDFCDCVERYKAEYVRRELKMVKSREWKLERIFKGDFAQRNELTGKDGEAIKYELSDEQLKRVFGTK